MLRRENRFTKLIQRAKRSDAPAELRLRDEDLVVVVFPKRDYDRLRGFRKLERFIAKHPKSLEEHLKETSDVLKRYEKKYGMTSAEFYRRFQSGELGEDELDYFDWRVEYGSFNRMKKRVANAKRQTA